MDIDQIAAALDRARQERQPIDPLSEAHGLDDVDTAYRIQQAWMNVLRDRGDVIVGRKIGLTSKAMQQQLGVSEPDYGTLLSSWEFAVEDGRAVVDASQLIAPRVEGEIAFRLAEPLEGPGLSVLDVFSATEAIAASIEIIDSRIRDWRIKLVDTVADNASAGGFAVGEWRRDWRALDMTQLGMVMYVNGEPQAIGAGAAALGHPARCVAWLANKLGTMGDRLEAGDVVLSGSLGPAVPVQSGTAVRLEIGGLEPISVTFEGYGSQRG